MATPTEKAAAMDEFLDDVLRVMNPDTRGRRGSISADVCAFCNGPATEFESELSKREYAISGICQKCQDETFDEH